MDSGRELDNLIHEKVMGRTARPDLNSFGQAEFVAPKNYSTDIRDAWEVVEKIKDLKLPHSHSWFTFRNSNGNEATFEIDGYYKPDHFARGTTAPHAICLAALKAVGYDLKA